MNFLYVVLLALFVLALNILTQTYQLRCYFHLDHGITNAEIFYLYPLCRILIEMKEDKPYLSVYVLKIRVYKNRVQLRKKTADRQRSLIKSADITNIRVDAYYGLKNPFITGILYGAVSMVSKFFHIDKINQHPEFLTDSEYIYLDATANINLWHTIMNYAKNKNK